MSPRRQPHPVHLDARGITALPTADIHAILRAADDLIAVGGRTLLVKILRGSQAQDVLSHGLQNNPAYGFYQGVAEEDVLARVDWMLLHGYLRIEFAGHVPVLVFTPKGWAIECDNMACELVRGFDGMLASGEGPYDMGYLKERNREMILLVLDKVQHSGDPKYLPLLADWARIDCKKVQQRIRELVRSCARA
jgi:hypothetical protein